ncbi:hypothetical protein BKA62DRAFT_772044 [Auriculariales sp. MPI-PUGE-AT-0066]|nr:hypothetical protein BKA62DRAFT_772044 [Auriculariales sp. MPI-PUGE-AT-0066]
MSSIASSSAVPQSAAQAVTDPPLPDVVVHLQRSMKVLETAASTLATRKSMTSATKEHARLLVTAGNRLTSAIIAACAHRPGDLHILAKVHVSVAREPKLSTSLAVYERFKVVVQGLANMTDGAPWPWKAIPQTVLQFTSMVERALDQPQKVRDLTDRIARRVSLLLNITRNKGSSNQELDAYVELFLADVQRIIMRLRIIEKTHPAKAFPLTDHIDAVIELQVSRLGTLLTAPTEESKVRFAVHTAYGVDATKDMVTEIHARVVSSSSQQAVHISIRARLPARPSCFKGRMNQLSALVNLVCESLNARIAIMGPGGMGKTTLAKAILHDEAVVNIVQDNRFFVSVEDVIDIESAATRLAEQLGVGETSDPQSAAISALQTCSRSLLIIDNLETLWFSNNAAAQKDTERPADVRSLTLISAELEAISLDAARETFEQIAGRPSLATEFTALDQLLTGVDYIPLAVTLLAQLARQKNSPSQLLQRWHHSKTAFIRTGGDHRESSVNVSIQISLDLLSAMTGGTEGGQLLSICAHLPDGLRLPVFAQLVSHFSDIHVARDLLVAFALISVGSNDELRMLSPVRHFVLNRLPMTAGHLAALRGIYFAVAASGPITMDEDFSQLAKNVAPEYGNLTSLLLHLIETEEPSQELHDAVDHVSEYSYYTAPSTTLRESFRLRLTTHPAWLAECLFNLGRTRLKRDEYSLAMENFQAARKLYATLDDKIPEAQCRLLLGQCLQMQGSYEAAERELHAARDSFLELDRELDAARCAQELGNIYRMRGEDEQAVVHFTSARDTFKGPGERLYAAQCTLRLGLIQLDQDNLPAAESELQSAMSQFEAVCDSLGAAQCRNYLGDVRIRQGDYDSAEKLLVSAKEVYVQLGMQSDLASCHWSFGTLYCDQCRALEAIESFETARNIYGLLGLQRNVASCSSEISELRNAM